MLVDSRNASKKRMGNSLPRRVGIVGDAQGRARGEPISGFRKLLLQLISRSGTRKSRQIGKVAPKIWWRNVNHEYLESLITHEISSIQIEPIAHFDLTQATCMRYFSTYIQVWEKQNNRYACIANIPITSDTRYMGCTPTSTYPLLF